MRLNQWKNLIRNQYTVCTEFQITWVSTQTNHARMILSDFSVSTDEMTHFIDLMFRGHYDIVRGLLMASKVIINLASKTIIFVSHLEQSCF